jgi:tetratricopeptide (TPR) repeat protein
MHLELARNALAILCIALGCAAFSGCADDPLEEVQALHAQDRHLESLELLEALLEERPDDPEMHYLYGVASLRTGRASQGMWSLRRAREFEDWELRAGIELARAGLQSGDDATSIEAASRVLEQEPDQRPALDMRAEAQVRHGAYEAALEDAARLQELGGNEGEVALLRLRALIGLRRVDEAGQLFAELEEALAEGGLALPAERYCAARGTFAVERGDVDAAREIFEDCLAEHPSDLLLLKSALDFLDAQRDHERGVELLESALAQTPGALQVRQVLSRRLRAMGRLEDAERVLLDGTQLEPAVLAATSWGALGVHYFEIQDFDAAVEAWSRLLELVPEPGDEVRLAYAEALALTGRYERALEIAQKLPNAQHQLLRGRVLLEQRRAPEALQALDAAIRLWPDNAVARYYAARGAEHTGEFDRAISEYRASVRTDPAATDAGLRLGRLHAAERQLEPALIALGHHLRGQPNDGDALALHYRLSVRQGNRAVASQILLRLSRAPGEHGRALAEAAKTLAARQGHAAAAAMLLGETPALDPTLPSHQPALRALVEHLVGADRSREAVTQAERALGRGPDVAALHEIHARALEGSGALGDAVRLAHERAVELDPNHAASWRALGRLAAEAGDVDTALDRYARAHAAAAAESREAADIGVELAKLQVSADRSAAARRLLEDLLWQHPLDARIASLMAELEERSSRARALQRRAERFRSAPADQG